MCHCPHHKRLQPFRCVLRRVCSVDEEVHGLPGTDRVSDCFWKLQEFERTTTATRNTGEKKNFLWKYFSSSRVAWKGHQGISNPAFASFYIKPSFPIVTESSNFQNFFLFVCLARGNSISYVRNVCLQTEQRCMICFSCRKWRKIGWHKVQRPRTMQRAHLRSRITTDATTWLITCPRTVATVRLRFENSSSNCKTSKNRFV